MLEYHRMEGVVCAEYAALGVQVVVMFHSVRDDIYIRIIGRRCWGYIWLFENLNFELDATDSELSRVTIR